MRALVVVACAALLAGASAALGVEASVSAVPIDSFKSKAIGQAVDKLIWRGGIAMTSPVDTFGGMSGLAPVGPNQHVVFVSDRGQFISGQLAYDGAARLIGFIGVTIEPMRNSKGEPLPRQYARDAESVDTVYRAGMPVAVRVSFENLTRVADYALSGGVPVGAAREVPLPSWLSELRTNESLESLCIAPPASPVAGSTVLITENALDEAGHHRGWMLGQSDKGPLSYVGSAGLVPTDCAFLPNGDMLVLERGVAFLSFSMTVRRVKAADVRPGAVMQGELLLSAGGGQVDNMESLAVHTAPNGETRILVGSDDNFLDWQRNLLLEFALPD